MHHERASDRDAHATFGVMDVTGPRGDRTAELRNWWTGRGHISQLWGIGRGFHAMGTLICLAAVATGVLFSVRTPPTGQADAAR
jgi:hypothetical protein